ncbi:hypothetical protein ACWF94_28370 [Streptomyces sp. NPDC055078]
MHTVGHPDGGSGTTHTGTTSGADHASTTSTASTADSLRMAPAPLALPGDNPGHVSGEIPGDRSHGVPGSLSGDPALPAQSDADANANATTDADGLTGAHGPGMAMDMAALCVAVLATWVLIALLRAALGRGAEWLVPLRASVMAALRPGPPPPRPNLAQLSILRI